MSHADPLGTRSETFERLLQTHEHAPQSWSLSVDKVFDVHGWTENPNGSNVGCFPSDGLGTTYALVAAYV